MEMYGYEFIRESDLTHHGIKGQKWGIRRFQNEDGTLTAAGKKRYVTVENFNNAQVYKKARKDYDAAYNKAYHNNHPYSLNKVKRQETHKNWEDVHDTIQALEKAKKKYQTSNQAAKEQATREKLENKVSRKFERKGTSSQKAKEVGKAYADLVMADKAYDKAYSAVNRSFPMGKKYKARCNQMVESLNDYYIARDTYQIAKIEANAEARRSKGWR